MQLYHTTPRRNLPGILQGGINPVDSLNEPDSGPSFTNWGALS